MSRRMKITLPDPVMCVLEDMAYSSGEPVSRVAALLVRDGLAQLNESGQSPVPPVSTPASSRRDRDQRPPWLEPYTGNHGWRSEMWGAIVALHGRYPTALGNLKTGWWETEGRVETLCALVIWRDWIDRWATDPRDELTFHAQLSDYGRELRQESGSVSSAWTPGAPPEGWGR
jgi:hypothetical protein